MMAIVGVMFLLDSMRAVEGLRVASNSWRPDVILGRRRIAAGGTFALTALFAPTRPAGALYETQDQEFLEETSLNAEVQKDLKMIQDDQLQLRKDKKFVKGLETEIKEDRNQLAKARLVQDTVKVGELESKIGQLVDQEADLLEEEAALKEDIQAKKRAEFEAERKLMRANDELSTLGVY